jgi:hypothetical protein
VVMGGERWRTSEVFSTHVPLRQELVLNEGKRIAKTCNLECFPKVKAFLSAVYSAKSPSDLLYNQYMVAKNTIVRAASFCLDYINKTRVFE